MNVTIETHHTRFYPSAHPKVSWSAAKIFLGEPPSHLQRLCPAGCRMSPCGDAFMVIQPDMGNKKSGIIATQALNGFARPFSCFFDESEQFHHFVEIITGQAFSRGDRYCAYGGDDFSRMRKTNAFGALIISGKWQQGMWAVRIAETSPRHLTLRIFCARVGPKSIAPRGLPSSLPHRRALLPS